MIDCLDRAALHESAHSDLANESESAKILSRWRSGKARIDVAKYPIDRESTTGVNPTPPSLSGN